MLDKRARTASWEEVSMPSWNTCIDFVVSLFTVKEGRKSPLKQTLSQPSTYMNKSCYHSPFIGSWLPQFTFPFTQLFLYPTPIQQVSAIFMYFIGFSFQPTKCMLVATSQNQVYKEKGNSFSLFAQSLQNPFNKEARLSLMCEFLRLSLCSYNHMSTYILYS